MAFNQFPASSGSLTQDKTVVYGTPGTFTFTPPTGTSSSNPLLCEVTVIGGGGGGGNYSSSGTSGQGGGAAQVVKQSRLYVTGPTTVTVGAGGAAQTAGGSSTFSGLTALGGVAGTAATTSTAKNAGMDDCTKGAAGKSAVNAMFTNADNYSSEIYFKSTGNFSQTGNLTTSISAPPLSSPAGGPTAALAGNVYVYCVNEVNGNGYGGGQNTAFYSNGSWTIRSTQGISGANYFVMTIGTTALCFPGGSAGNYNNYYYATAGQTSWTTGYLPISGGSGQPWFFDFTKDGNEIFAANYARSAFAGTVDGINWTTYTAPTQIYGTGGAGWIQYLYSQSYYVLSVTTSIGQGQTIYTSPNLTSWTGRTVNHSYTYNLGSSGGGLQGTGTGGNLLYWHGDRSQSSYSNTFYTGDGYNWNAAGWYNDQRQTPSVAAPLWYTAKNNFVVQGCNAYSGNSYTALFYGNAFATDRWYSTFQQRVSAVSLVSLPGQSNGVPTTFPNLSEFEPTGGSSGVPSAGGDGGDGGGYTSPTVKATATGAAPTIGQVPGAGGGGGGAGSTTGAVGAAGLVSIKYYG